MTPPASLESRRAYDLWAPAYPASPHNPLMRTEQAVVVPIITSLRPACALDIGTGSGRYLAELGAAGAATVVGLDWSMAMLSRGPRIGWRVCGDARRLPFAPARFDLVNASLVAADIASLADWLREVARIVSIEGHVIYSDLHPTWQRHGWRRTFEAGGRTFEVPYVAHGLDDHLAALIGAGFDLLACHEAPLIDDDSAALQAHRRRWGCLPVLVVLHARKASR